jgi:hypothetical protein
MSTVVCLTIEEINPSSAIHPSLSAAGFRKTT